MGLRLKQERFAQEYVIDGNGTQAAIRSGYSKQSAHVHSNWLLNNPRVIGEIASLQAAAAQRAAKRLDITLDRLTGMFIEDRDFAREVGQASAAVSATDKLARLHGFMVDKSISMNVTAQMSDDDLMLLVRQLQQPAAAPALEPRSSDRVIEATTTTSNATPRDTPAKARVPKSLKRKRNPKSKR